MSTTFTPGDVALVGFTSDTTTGTGQAPGKSFSFVFLKDVVAGATLNFTDDGALAAGGFRAGEGIGRYVAPAGGAAAGTVVSVTASTANPSVYTTTEGAVTAVGGAFNLSTTADSITLFQGDAATPTNLFALHTVSGTTFDADATTSTTSALPAGLTLGTTALAFASRDGGYTGPTTGTAAQLLADIDDASNWTFTSAPATTPAAPFPTAFTVQGAAGPDTTAPVLSTTTPAPNATGVAVGSSLVLTFSEAVQAGAGNITLGDGGAHAPLVIAVTDAAQVAVGGDTVTITPTGGLQASDTYHLALDAGVVTDAAGNAVAADADALDFTTAAPVTPIPGGAQGAQFSITAPGTYLLAANTTLTETANHPAISAAVTDGAAVTTLDIEGAIVGFDSGAATTKGGNGVTAALANGTITVGAGASISVEDAKGLNFNPPAAGPGMTVTNLGQIVSHTNTAPNGTVPGASQASGAGVDFSAVASPTAGDASHVTGGVLTNGSATAATALIRSDSADGVDLGGNQTLTNYGRIVGDSQVDDSANNNTLVAGGSTTKRFSASVGVEINAHNHDTVANYGTIEGSQHGVDGGDASDTDLVVTNAAGGVITGHNGSGVGSDATAAAATNVVVTNSGVITGASDPLFDRSGAVSRDGDGDGVDVDGGATVTNAHGATIQGVGAAGFDSNGRANHSEGLSLGGGVVDNHGVISGADYAITVNNDSNAGRSGVADTTIVNESDGSIVGVDGYAIRLENKGADGLDTDSLTNHGTITGGGAAPDGFGTATIEGGGADQNTVGVLNGVTYAAGQAGDARFVSGDGAAVQTGEGRDTLVNDGTITGANGHAISLEGGDDALTLYAEGVVNGGIDGGVGDDTLTLTAHANTARSLGGVTGFEHLHVEAGSWTLTDAQGYSAGATISAGATLGFTGAGALAGPIADQGALAVFGAGSMTIDASVSGTGTLEQAGSGVTTLTTAHQFASTSIVSGTLDVAAVDGAGAGVLFAASGGPTRTLHVEATALAGGDFAARIDGFAADDTLDVGGVGAHAHATLGAGDVLTVTGDAGSATLHLDPGQNFSADVFNAAADAADGANITLAAAPDAPTVLFSETFDGFTAAGFSPTPTAGQLDSDVWRVSGLTSDPAPAFGFTDTGAEFARGVIQGSDDPFSAGVYSPSADHALVLQPTGAELESGGFIEARIVNATGAAANPPTVDFDWTFRNSGARADDLQLSYSTDDVNFTAVPGADFTTPGGADATVAAAFGARHEHVDLTGLNLSAGGDLYLRWTHLNSTGTGNRDEVGIDDVVVEAAPSAPVSGTAFSIAAADADKAEGAAGATTPFTFTVTRAGDAGAAGDVGYAVAGSGPHPADAADFAGGVLPSGVLHFAAGQTSRTLTVGVAGDGATEPAETFGVGLVDPTGGATIAGAAAVGAIRNDDSAPITVGALQGAAQTSPFAGQSVSTEGVVTAVDTTGSKGFWIQSEAGHQDGDSATSDAVFVFTNAAPTVEVGHLVTVTGLVTEFAGSGAGAANNLTVTELNSPVVADLGAGHTVATTVIGEGGIEPPNVQIASDGFATYDPTRYAADFYESLEGMKVTVHAAQAVDSTFSGETYIVPDGGAHGTLNARGGVTITEPAGADPAHADYEPERIELFEDSGVLPGFTPAYQMGDHLGDVTGVVSYFNGNYELLPTVAPAAVDSAGPVDDVTALHASATQLTVGAYNIDNLGPTGLNAADTATRYAALAHDIATNLGGPVILGVEEIQDADGEGASSNLSGAATLTDLAQAVTAAGGPAYSFTEVAPTTANSTGGAPDGNIRSAFLYDAARVQLVAGSTRLIDDPAHPDGSSGGTFTGQREPLAADFLFDGQKVTVIDVHALSRLGGDELFGRDQPPLVAGDDRRTAMADAVFNYVVGLEAADPGANIVVEGDFNGFYFETAQTDLTRPNAAGQPALTNLVTADVADPAERYSYNFEGDSEQLDNLYVSPHLLAAGTQFDDVHVNTGKLASAVTDPDGQASDHDPVLSQLTLPAAASPPTGGGGPPGGGGVMLTGGAAAATLQGGAGDDTLTAGASGDTLLGGAGDDHLAGGSGHALLFGNAGADVIVLNPATLSSTVFGGQGDDVVDASASTHANLLSGDLGNDVVRAGSGGDTALGGAGADTLVTGSGHDQLFGNADADHLSVTATSAGASLYGGQGDDVIDASASAAQNYLSGDIGNDTITVGAGSTTVLGGQGDDVITGGAGAGAGSLQFLFGNQGNDILSYAGHGSVEAFGGQDGDTLSLTSSGQGLTHDLFGNLGDDTLSASGGYQALYGGKGNDVVTAAGDATGHDVLSGDLGDDAITSSVGGADTVSGGPGADVITLTRHAAGAGDTVLVGAGGSTAAPGAGETNLDHVAGFDFASDHLVVAGHAAGAATNLATFTDTAANASEAAAFSAAYLYAFGDGTGAHLAHVGTTEYLAVQEAYGGTTAVYLFTADHTAVAFTGATTAVFQVGAILAG